WQRPWPCRLGLLVQVLPPELEPGPQPPVLFVQVLRRCCWSPYRNRTTTNGHLLRHFVAFEHNR
ncbi:hypothetical protein CF161_13713, partial [Pseudomonas sp. CF161]